MNAVINNDGQAVGLDLPFISHPCRNTRRSPIKTLIGDQYKRAGCNLFHRASIFFEPKRKFNKMPEFYTAATPPWPLFLCWWEPLI